MTTIALLAAMAFVMVVFCRVPVVLFLEYEPKDLIITLGGFIWGPFTSFVVSVIVSFIEMITISEDGIIGFIMNIISSGTFALAVGFVYKYKRSLSGAIIASLVAVISVTVMMMLANIIITPIYMHYPRSAVIKLIPSLLLPFNLAKSIMNASVVLFLQRWVHEAIWHLMAVRLLPTSAWASSMPDSFQSRRRYQGPLAREIWEQALRVSVR